eukprot:CAMPEP_0202900924 /NCGR_PEP_ID=MMETSP1392-20130828/12111_1 /ASSEMBLY_ACC=CAM_ASM_000868 /TAXON_ID=225041 /ORGANISM="Chlamydomonas chlamydogama, Strain SAG 11-48b" /LENGTH=157 /DNA_ID=CAMNT_0049587383 /DNA_START=87 /DNA_END=560 /DNA_ORIENTATION=+
MASKQANPDDQASKGKSALPPACPRCELTKQQFNRTILNYQKAYRKKVEGLKTELKAMRTNNTQLQKQVNQLKSIARVHAPSIAIGLLIGLAAHGKLGKLFSRFWGKRSADTGSGSGTASVENKDEGAQTAGVDNRESGSQTAYVESKETGAQTATA